MRIDSMEFLSSPDMLKGTSRLFVVEGSEQDIVGAEWQCRKAILVSKDADWMVGPIVAKLAYASTFSIRALIAESRKELE
jgi:hypothetical protein